MGTGYLSPMLRAVLRWLRDLIAVEDSEDRIEGSGEVILDPAYNSRYEAEGELKRLSNIDDDDRGSSDR